MRSLYQVSKDIQAVIDIAVDTETGEVVEVWVAKLQELEQEKEHVALHLARAHKDTLAELEAVAKVADDRAKEAAALRAKAASLKRTVAYFVEPGQRYKDEQASISWRASEYVDVRDESLLPVSVLVHKDPTVDKVLLKREIKAGRVTELAAGIQSRSNLQIK